MMLGYRVFHIKCYRVLLVGGQSKSSIASRTTIENSQVMGTTFSAIIVVTI